MSTDNRDPWNDELELPKLPEWLRSMGPIWVDAIRGFLIALGLGAVVITARIAFDLLFR